MKITPNVPTNAFTLKAQATWNVLFDDNNKAVAIFSTKSRLADVAIMASEMYELIQMLVRTWEDDCQFIPCDTEAAFELSNKLARLAAQAAPMLAKIEGGGE